MIGLIKGLGRRTPLGWFQLKHDRTRLLTAIFGIAFADVLMFMQLGFQNALYDSNTRLHRSLNADLVIFGKQARNITYLSTFPRRRLYQSMDVPGVESAQGLYINFVDWKNPQTKSKTSILVIGQNPAKLAFTQPEINQNLNSIKLPDTYLFDRSTRGSYQESIAQIEQGQTVRTEIQRRTISISGLFEIGASFATDGTLITSDQNFLRLFGEREAGTVSLALIKLKPGYDLAQVQESLKTHLQDDVSVLTIEEFVNFEKKYWAENSAIGFVFGLGTVMGFMVGVIIVYQILSTDVNAHMAEYATFKAMGYRHIYLLGVVFEEAIILAILGFIPGVSVSMWLYNLTRTATSLPLAMPSIRVLRVLILTIIMCAISGAIATRKLQSADPADIF